MLEVLNSILSSIVNKTIEIASQLKYLSLEWLFEQILVWKKNCKGIVKKLKMLEKHEIQYFMNCNIQCWFTLTQQQQHLVMRLKLNQKIKVTTRINLNLQIIKKLILVFWHRKKIILLSTFLFYLIQSMNSHGKSSKN
jgi:hypothetical protein